MRELQTRWHFAQVKSFVGVGGMGADWSLCRLRVLFTPHWLSLQGRENYFAFKPDRAENVF